MLVGFIVVAVEGIGDITATEEASQLATTGTAHARRIQGGILADGRCQTLIPSNPIYNPTTEHDLKLNNPAPDLHLCSSRLYPAAVLCT